MTSVRAWRSAESLGRWQRVLAGDAPAGDIGVNLARLRDGLDSCGSGCHFVDLGVDHGVSSMAMAADAVHRGNDVYGVDVRFPHLGFDLRYHPRYQRVRADSVTAGKWWRGPRVDAVFIDTLHVSPQVLCELYFWQPLVRVGGLVIAHDTAWPDGVSDLGWRGSAQRAGMAWPTPDRAIAAFFGLEEQFRTGKYVGFRYETRDITVHHYPESNGMTFVRMKRRVDFRARITAWERIFADREQVVRTVLAPQTIRLLDIDFSRGPANPSLAEAES